MADAIDPEGRESPLHPTPEINALYLRGLRDYLLRHGIDLDRFMAAHRLEAGICDAPRVRLHARIYQALLVDAGRLTQDPDVGLHVGEHIRPGHYGVLGFAVMACRTTAEVYRRHERYEDLVASIGRSRYRQEGDRVYLTWDTGDTPWHRAVFDETLASWVTFARWLVSRDDHDPLEVHFPYPQPASIREHERIFRCRLVFGARFATVVFPAAFLDLPLAQFDPTLCRLMDERAEEELKALGGGDWITRVRRQIVGLLSEGEVSLGRVAEGLDLSERALQRRLRDEGYGYQQVLDDTRRTLALEYIRDPGITLAEVAFLLGFADQSTFNRAFRQWTGQSPGKYRREVGE
ncbi:AraC family transcriptional regulator ligand-binding domain-containing protein [Marinobacteraceae bacterium S3BR75-40.1]